jgi:3'-phosphoadenosine 5'-phosphosulfate (PAPS) 3'-phosphatase
VGEEDGGPHDESAWEGVAIPELKGCELDEEISKSEHTVPISTLCIFVDPVDGTREFVEGRLQAVQTLIGVSYMGRSIAGAVGIPFPEGKISNPPSVVYALVGAGVGRYGFQPPATVVEDQEGWSVTTGDSKVDTIINAAVAVAQPPRRVIMGAVRFHAQSLVHLMIRGSSRVEHI